MSCLEPPLAFNSYTAGQNISGNLVGSPGSVLSVSVLSPIVVPGTVVGGNGVITIIDGCQPGEVSLISANWIEGSFGAINVTGCPQGCVGTATPVKSSQGLKAIISVQCEAQGRLSNEAVIGIAMGAAVVGVAVILLLSLLLLRQRSQWTVRSNKRLKDKELQDLTRR